MHPFKTNLRKQTFGTKCLSRSNCYPPSTGMLLNLPQDWHVYTTLSSLCLGVCRWWWWGSSITPTCHYSDGGSTLVSFSSRPSLSVPSRGLTYQRLGFLELSTDNNGAPGPHEQGSSHSLWRNKRNLAGSGGMTENKCVCISTHWGTKGAENLQNCCNNNNQQQQ